MVSFCYVNKKTAGYCSPLFLLLAVKNSFFDELIGGDSFF